MKKDFPEKMKKRLLEQRKEILGRLNNQSDEMKSLVGTDESGERKSAVEQQDEMIKNRHRRVRKAVSSVHCMPPSINKDFQESVTKNNQDNGLSDTKED